jgi:4-amino-4-deoxy-L-arabinose transferase-like glycosyltransferase
LNNHRLETALFILVMLFATGLRVLGLSGAPPGFSDDELKDLRITDQVRMGQVSVFYAVVDEEGGREGLYYPLLSVFTSLVGDGLYDYRLLSVLLNLLTLAFIYGLGRRLFGTTAAMLALAALAVGYWPVFTARMVAREALLPFFAVGAAYALVRGFTTPSIGAGDQTPAIRLAVGGLLTGLALYVHWAGFVIIAVFLLFSVYLAFRRRLVARSQRGNVSFVLLIVLIIAVPFSVSILRAPGISALNYHLTHLPDALPQSIVNTLGGLFWQGDLDPTRNLPGRPVFGLVGAVLFVVGVGVALRRLGKPVHALLLIALLVGLVPEVVSPGGPDFKRLAITMPALYLTLGLGADAALRALVRRGVSSRVVVVAILVLFVFGFTLTAHDLNAVWAVRGDVFTAYHANLGRLASHLEATARHIPTSICSPALNGASPDSFSDREILAYMLHQSDLSLRYVDCRSSLVLAQGGARQQIAFTYADGPALLAPPLTAWLEDAQEVPVPGLPPGSVVQIEVEQPLQDLLGSFITTAPAGFAPESPGGAGSVTLPVRLGGNVTFAGYQVGQEVYRSGDVVEVVTYWRVDGPTPSGLHMFAHLLFDPGGNPAAQEDVLGAMVETLRPSDFFVQLNLIELPDQMLAGYYDLSVGLYRTADGQRLPVLDDGQPRGDRLFLQQIQIVDE